MNDWGWFEWLGVALAAGTVIAILGWIKDQINRPSGPRPDEPERRGGGAGAGP
jgi:hypothetical protein